MSVNLRRFVNLNITRATRNTVNPIRDTVALFGATSTDIDDNEDIIFISGKTVTYREGGKQKKKYVLRSINNEIIEYEEADFNTTPLYAYAKKFFDNGGIKLHVYQGYPTCDGEESNLLKINDKFVPDEEIAIAWMGTWTESQSSAAKTRDGGSEETSNDVTDISNTVIDAYNKLNNPTNPEVAGVSQPNIITSSCKVFFNNTENDEDVSDFENYCFKYGKPGIEMTILAYLSKINAYGENTVNDYSFTIESIDDMTVEDALSQETEKNVYTDDKIVGTCMENNINIDTVLANNIRNVGGNLSSGIDLVNYYMMIVLQQTVEASVVNVLSDKLSGAEGTAIIYNAIVTQLNKYNRSGLIAAGNWKDEDWSITFNGDTYTVASANERFVLGYKVLVVPFASLNSEQISAHECPPIYIALTNKYGIRKVTINGEVI